MRAIRDMAIIVALASLALAPAGTSAAQTPAASPPPVAAAAPAVPVAPAPPAATAPEATGTAPAAPQPVAVAAPAAEPPAGPAEGPATAPQPAAAPAAAPVAAASLPSVVAGLPIKLGASVTVRHELTNLEDRADLILAGNNVTGLLGRFRFWADYKDPNSFTGGGIRFSVGETPNPAVPYIRLGDGFRPQTFSIDQFYLTLKPFKNRDRLSVSFGKVPLPWWRGDRGTVRSETIWDDDINPVGGLANVLIYKNKSGSVQLDNQAGSFIIEWFRQDRFAGLRGDIFLFSDQLHLRAGHFSAAAAYYQYENLNSGAVAPSFIPGSSASQVTPQNAFLLRTGFQATNAGIEIGPGARGFRSERFKVLNLIGQVDIPLHFESLGKPEIFIQGEYLHNYSVPNVNNGWGVTVGFSGGKSTNKWIRPFNFHGTYRDIEADATLGTFADSDLGAGTDVKGWEVSGNYKLTKNVTGAIIWVKFDGSPLQSTNVRRWFFDLIWDF